MSFSWCHQRKVDGPSHPHTLQGARGHQLVDFISRLHLLEAQDRCWLLINPPNPAALHVFALVTFWVKVNDSILLPNMFFRKVIHVD